jgi:hypothetical protein
MLQPVVSACYAAGSTYGTLAASKPRERDVPPAVTGKFSTLVSIHCQRRPGRVKATVCVLFSAAKCIQHKQLPWLPLSRRRAGIPREWKGECSEGLERWLQTVMS